MKSTYPCIASQNSLYLLNICKLVFKTTVSIPLLEDHAVVHKGNHQPRCQACLTSNQITFYKNYQHLFKFLSTWKLERHVLHPVVVPTAKFSFLFRFVLGRDFLYLVWISGYPGFYLNATDKRLLLKIYLLKAYQNLPYLLNIVKLVLGKIWLIECRVTSCG